MYAQIYELQSLIPQQYNALDLRQAAKQGRGHWLWETIKAHLAGRSIEYRKSDLVQAINNVAAQMEAKADTVHWNSVVQIERFIEGWQKSATHDVFGPDQDLIALIIAEATRQKLPVNSATAHKAIENVRNLLVAEKAAAARQAQREAAAPAPATDAKPMVEWTDAEWEAAEATAKGQDAELAAKNEARRDQAIDILETYRQVLRTEKQYSELTGDFMGTIPVIEGMRKMIRGLESLIEALA